MLTLAARFAPATPVKMLACDGYFVTMFRKDGTVLVHLLATEYDAHVDEKLDGTRTHRSRVNFIDRATPLGVTGTVRFATAGKPEVILPLREEKAMVTEEAGTFTATLPKDCFYAVIRVAMPEA